MAIPCQAFIDTNSKKLYNISAKEGLFVEIFYDDYEIIEELDRRKNNRYYRMRCTICGHEKECAKQNILKQDNHHSCKNCHEDYYKSLVGNKFGDYICESITFVSKTKGYVANMRCAICGHQVKKHITEELQLHHNAYTCENDYHNSLVGKRFGDLIIESVTNEYSYGAVVYDCRCAICGLHSYKIMSSLKKNIKHGTQCLKLIQDDELKKIVVQRFYNMYQRCNNPKNTNYKHYGGRGIKLMYDNAIDLYNDFADELREYAKTHDIRNCTFDRIDVNGNYEKSNLRIATQQIQSVNSTRKKLFIIEKDGERILSDCASECGRYLNLNGRAIGNMIRGKSKSCGGWKLYRIVDLSEDIDEVVTKEGVTTKLIVS